MQPSTNLVLSTTTLDAVPESNTDTRPASDVTLGLNLTSSVGDVGPITNRNVAFVAKGLRMFTDVLPTAGLQRLKLSQSCMQPSTLRHCQGLLGDVTMLTR